MLVPTDYLLAYVSSAQPDVIQHWLESRMDKSPHEMAHILAQTAFLGAANVAGLQRK